MRRGIAADDVGGDFVCAPDAHDMGKSGGFLDPAVRIPQRGMKCVRFDIIFESIKENKKGPVER